MAKLLYHSYRQLNEFKRSLNVLEQSGFGPGTVPFELINNLRSTALAKLGFKSSKPVSLLLKLTGLSPGIIKVFHDAESGFMSEARVKPGAPPVLRHISDDVAITILKGELTHEIEDELMTPDDYIGE